MSPIVNQLQVGIISAVVFLVCGDLPGRPVLAAEPALSAPCATPDFRQFDFWAGSWDVFDVDSPAIPVARARVDLILDGCVLREDYQGTDGHIGQSFTTFDTARKVWHQTWVTNNGQLLVIEGKFENGEMLLSGEDHAKNALVRGEWKPENGNVRETAATTTDGGKTWKPWFDLIFKQAGAMSAMDNARLSGADDQKIIAALDTEYQAAVKENDAATMDQILADNFVLVSSSGKTYSKPDLLAEARNRRAHYARQDDTDQNVRVWSDTAVITARLTEKGTEGGKPFDKTVWFCDTYFRTPTGWRYVFGHAWLPSPQGR